MTGISIALIIVVLALCAVIVFLIKTHREETKDLHLRLASKSPRGIPLLARRP